MNPTRLRDILAAVSVLILAIATIIVLIPYGVESPASVKNAALAPDFWPRIIAVAAALASLFLLFETIGFHAPHDVPSAEDDYDAQFDHDAMIGNFKVLGLIVAMFVFYFSLPTLGVVAASVILMAAMMLYFGERNLWLVSGLSIGLPILLYVFFRYVASVPIPLGVFAS